MTRSRRLLQVGGDSAHARAVADMLAEAKGDPFSVCHEQTLAGAAAALEEADVVLLHPHLPCRSGLEALAALHGANEALPVVALVDRADSDLCARAISQGAQDCLVKDDLTPDLLHRALANALARHAYAEELRLATVEMGLRNATLEGRVQDRTARMLEARREADRAMAALRPEISEATHHLRTCLTAILGFGNVLQRGAYGELNEAQARHLNDILDSGREMEGHLERLLGAATKRLPLDD